MFKFSGKKIVFYRKPSYEILLNKINELENEIVKEREKLEKIRISHEEMLDNIASAITFNNSEKKCLKKPELKEEFFTLQKSLEELKKIVPRTFEIWQGLFENGKHSYLTDPVHNLIVEESAYAHSFDSFSKIYLNKPGYLLDVGCGPQKFPAYLSGFPEEYIVGIDPLLPLEEHPFEFIQGIAEYIPYKDKSFDYVLSATSLDHVLLLDKALEEFYRVLKDDGILLLWCGELVGSKEYNPYSDDVEAIDSCHLFHISPSWFEPMMEKLFIKDCHYTKWYGERFADHFYAFKKKNDINANKV